MKYSDSLTADKVKKPGTIVADWFDEGLRIIIMRGPVSWCVYLGVPNDHPLAGFSYDDIPVDCHGGLTFASQGQNQWPKEFFWYGYDYAHLGDKVALDIPELAKYEKGDHRWTIGEIKKDAWTAIYSMRKLMKLAENIKKKS